MYSSFLAAMHHLTSRSFRMSSLIGLVDFQHLTPKAADYRYPYPDFLHRVIVATADGFDLGRREVGGYELESGFQPLAMVEALPISQGERALLRGDDMTRPLLAAGYHYD
jgi:hypothetical protein